MSPFVYIVDDDPDVRDSLRALLGTRPNLHLVPFASGDLFLEDIGNRETGVVLLDLHMPGTSGLDVLKCLVEQGHSHEVIILTGHGDVGSAVAAMKLDAADFLEKPCAHGDLFDAVDRSMIRIADGTAARKRRKEAVARLERLSDRERQVLDCLIVGKTNQATADELGITLRTVKFHRANAMEKLAAASLPEVLRLMIVAGQYNPVPADRA